MAIAVQHDLVNKVIDEGSKGYKLESDYCGNVTALPYIDLTKGSVRLMSLYLLILLHHLVSFISLFLIK